MINSKIENDYISNLLEEIDNPRKIRYIESPLTIKIMSMKIRTLAMAMTDLGINEITILGSDEVKQGFITEFEEMSQGMVAYANANVKPEGISGVYIAYGKTFHIQ